MPFMRDVERMDECSSPKPKEKYEKDCSYGGSRGRNIVTWRMLVGTATGRRRLGWSRTWRPRWRTRRWRATRRGHRATCDFCDLNILLTGSASWPTYPTSPPSLAEE